MIGKGSGWRLFSAIYRAITIVLELDAHALFSLVFPILFVLDCCFVDCCFVLTVGPPLLSLLVYLL